MKQALTRIGGLALAIGLLAFALRGVSMAQLAGQFQRADYRLVGVYVLVTLLIYWVRSKRWQQSLLALGYQPSVFRGMVAMQSGMVAAMIVPGAGELTRCLTLQRTDHVPIAQSLGSVVAERVIDLALLPLTLLITFVLQIDLMQTFVAGLSLRRPDLWLAGLLLTGASGLGLLFWLWQQPAVRRHPLAVRIGKFVRGFGEGFLVIRRLPNPALFIGLTVLSQVLAWLSLYLLMLALDTTRALPPVAPLTVLAVASVGGLAVPTQASLGTFHLLAGRALMLYGLSATEGTTVATFIHTVGFGINLIVNGFSFLLVPLLVRQTPGRPAPHPAESV
jgi:glycosyltransferase 2 family protein